MSTTIQHLTLRIFGEVQGVCFRAAAQHYARQHGITGFVRNESDGSVYIEAEGPETSLQKFKEWCNKGPSTADVQRVESTPGEILSYPDFSIRWT